MIRLEPENNAFEDGVTGFNKDKSLSKIYRFFKQEKKSIVMKKFQKINPKFLNYSAFFSCSITFMVDKVFFSTVCA